MLLVFCFNLLVVVVGYLEVCVVYGIVGWFVVLCLCGCFCCVFRMVV